MKAYGGLGYTSAPTWGLEYDKSLFPEMLKTIPSLTERFVGILLDRVREITRMEQQSEKLNALGKLAGNLAHELNNPASAAQRSAAGLLEELRVYGHERFNLGRLCLSATDGEKVLDWEDQVRTEAKRLGKPAETEQTHREDEMSPGFDATTSRNHGISLPSWPSSAWCRISWKRSAAFWIRAPSPWCSRSSLRPCARRESPRPCSTPPHGFSISSGPSRTTPT